MLRGRIRGLRWWIIGLIAVGTAINYLARASLATAAPTLTEKLNLTTQQYSYIVSAFQAAYTVMQPIAGYVIDLVGTKIGFAAFACMWSIANMLHGISGGWISLAVFRGLLGAAEAAVIPGGLKVVAEWFPPRERTVATGWFNSGASIGAMLAPPIVAWCILYFGWQSAFLVTGGVGLIWSAIWFLVYRRPSEHPGLTAEEGAHIRAGRADKPRVRTSWKVLIRRRGLWGIAIPRLLCDPAWQTFTFWIPLYLVSTRGLSLAEIAAFAWLPFLAADFGSIAGGYLAPLYLKYFRVSLLTSRKLVVATGALLMSGPALIGLAESPYVAIALFCVGGFAHQMLSGALLTLASDLFEPDDVATATGMAGSVSWSGAVVFSLVMGAVVPLVGYHPVFAALFVLDLLGVAVLWALIRAPRGELAEAAREPAPT